MVSPERNWRDGRNGSAREPICFPGFAQREDLAGLYALAETSGSADAQRHMGFGGERSDGVRTSDYREQCRGMFGRPGRRWAGMVMSCLPEIRRNSAWRSILCCGNLNSGKQMSARSSGANSKLLTGSMRRWSGRGRDLAPPLPVRGLDEFRETAAVGWHRAGLEPGTVFCLFPFARTSATFLSWAESCCWRYSSPASGNMTSVFLFC